MFIYCVTTSGQKRHCSLTPVNAKYDPVNMLYILHEPFRIDSNGSDGKDFKLTAIDAHRFADGNIVYDKETGEVRHNFVAYYGANNIYHFFKSKKAATKYISAAAGFTKTEYQERRKSDESSSSR